MSEKRKVTTFKLQLVQMSSMLEGPVVSPDQREVAENLTELHRIYQNHSGLLIYDRQWTYLPASSILFAQKGSRWFSLPWPLCEDAVNEAED